MERPLTNSIRADREPPSVKEYERTGGYQAARKALRSLARKSDGVSQEFQLAGARRRRLSDRFEMELRADGR